MNEERIPWNVSIVKLKGARPKCKTNVKMGGRSYEGMMEGTTWKNRGKRTG
jgi:hypothetical protein